MNRTSFLDCKHEHMMKSGVPPDKFGVMYHIVTYRINSKGYHSLVPGLISIFLEMVWFPLTLKKKISHSLEHFMYGRSTLIRRSLHLDSWYFM